MFCSRCGAKMEKGFQYCPVCGTKVQGFFLKGDEPESSISQQPEPIVQKKPMPLWFKIIAVIAVIALIGVTAGILFTESLVDVVDNQLDAIRQNEIDKAYYTYTSKEFQSTTDLDQFRKFIHTYPIFLNNQSAHFTKRSIKNNVGILKGNLTSTDRVNTPIEYKLIKEGDKWKILSIRLLKPNLIPREKDDGTTEDLTRTTTTLLNELQIGNISHAYQEYGSAEFKESTSENDFADFIKRYPILAHYQTISFPKAAIRDGIGTLAALLKEKNEEAYVKFYLINEDQRWKILSMRILSPEEENLEEPMEFGEISVGTKIDPNGLILQPQTEFSTRDNILYVNVDIENGVKGDTVNLRLQHLESGSTVPAKVIIGENGDTMLVSIFSPPMSGWLKGDYTLTVSTSSGESKTLDFSIN